MMGKGGGARGGRERGRPGRIHQATRPPSEAAFCSANNGVHCAGPRRLRGAHLALNLFTLIYSNCTRFTLYSNLCLAKRDGRTDIQTSPSGSQCCRCSKNLVGKSFVKFLFHTIFVVKVLNLNNQNVPSFCLLTCKFTSQIAYSFFFLYISFAQIYIV